MLAIAVPRYSMRPRLPVISRDGDSPLVTEQEPPLWVIHDRLERSPNAVNTHPTPYRPNAVTVVDVPIHVASVQGLDWNAGQVVPPVYRHTVRPLLQLGCHDHVLLDAGNEEAVSSPELFLDDALVLQERQGRVAI